MLTAKRTQAYGASPFLKWAGGKSQLLPVYDRYLANVKVEGYIEPFVGGGAVFFHLVRNSSHLLPSQPGRMVLSDYNEDLINCYKVVRDSVDELIELLRRMEIDFNKDQNTRRRLRVYSTTRRVYPLGRVDRAARLIFLNRTCYNGLYRVNSRGEFNVPMGRYRLPRILDEENIRAVSQTLQDVELLSDDFENIVRKLVRPGWFIYFDPPYVPMTQTANFTSYTRNGFGLGEQWRLAKLFADLDELGCYVMLSNSSHWAVAKFYQRYRPILVPARRAINSNPLRRGEIEEFLVLGFTLRKLLE
jgi:DNA adenine methylase